MLNEYFSDCLSCENHHRVESERHDDNMQNAYVIWCQLDGLRREIALGGKDLLVALLSAKIGLFSHNDIALFDKMSELMGGDMHELVGTLLDEFEGRLWKKDASGTYRMLA